MVHGEIGFGIDTGHVYHLFFYSSIFSFYGRIYGSFLPAAHALAYLAQHRIIDIVP